MPTFLVLKNSKPINTIRGANPSALRSAVTAAAADVRNAPAKSSAAFQTTGRTLGSGPGSGSGASTGAGGVAWPSVENWVRGWRIGSRGTILETVLTFVGLYLVTLFALDAGKAAEESALSVKNKRR
jgi:hypothetical protein